MGCCLWILAGRLNDRVPVAVTSAYSSETKPATCSFSSEQLPCGHPRHIWSVTIIITWDTLKIQRVSIVCRFFSDVGHVESALISTSGPSVFVNKINVYITDWVV